MGLRKQTTISWIKKTLSLSWKFRKTAGYVGEFTNLYTLTLDTFTQYIHSLEPDKIEQLDDNIKANWWGITSIVNIQNYVELLQCFEIFYYFDGCLLLTNGLLKVPDSKKPSGAEKISLERLYELYRGTKSNRLVSLQILSALNLFFGGDIQNSRDTIT